MLKKASDRVGDIYNYIKNANYASITALSKHFDISISTVKRDLDYLEQNHMVSRVRGGVMPVSTPTTPPTYSMRTSINMAEKRRIARAAAGFIADNDSIFLEGGSTCFELYKAITAKNVTVFTTNISAITCKNENVSHLFALPGEVFIDGGNLGGMLTVEALAGINPSKIFFSTAAISDALDILSEDISDRTMAKSIVQMSGQKILLAHSAKIGLCKAFCGESLSKIDVFITDDQIPRATAEAIRALGTQVIIA